MARNNLAICCVSIALGGFLSFAQAVTAQQPDSPKTPPGLLPDGAYLRQLRTNVIPTPVPPRAARVEYLIEPPDILTIELLKPGTNKPLTGERLVRTDGTVDLGDYGSVSVGGLSVDQARQTVVQHLARRLVDPHVHVDVYSYNSKGYYVVSNQGGKSEHVIRLPYTGNETVLDAIAQTGAGVKPGADSRVWLARPGTGVLPVRWNAIVHEGEGATNYPLKPNDRLYVESSPTSESDKTGVTFSSVGNQVQVSASGFTATANKIVTDKEKGVLRLQGSIRFKVEKDGMSIEATAEQLEVSSSEGKLHIKSRESKE